MQDWTLTTKEFDDGEADSPALDPTVLYNLRMKEHYTLELSGHQARVLNSALLLVRQFMDLPPDQPLFNIPNEGITSTLAKDEFLLIHEEVVRQFQEQDHQD